jgi:hypothetical protein
MGSAAADRPGIAGRPVAKGRTAAGNAAFSAESGDRRQRGVAEDGWKRIRIGDVEFRVVKPCSRCILTTIDPQTGERSADREPLATLQKYRPRPMARCSARIWSTTAMAGWKSVCR